jgi:DNA-binding transcriptional LysR family regulator
MELYQLENFVAVVEERSFTKAAARVFRTQGAVSVAIRKLEDEVGVSLLVRDSHECLLTKAGEQLLPYARHMLGLREKLTRSMLEFRTLGVGKVSIAAHESAAEYLLPAALAEFSAKNPKVLIEARLCDEHEIAHLVAEREVDLGFGISQTSRHGLCGEILHADPLVLVVPPTHHLAHRVTVSIAELNSERFIVHSRPSLSSCLGGTGVHTTMVDTVQRVFTSNGATMNVAAKLWKFDTIKSFVRAGGGLAIVPESVISSADIGTLIPIRISEMDITRSIEVIYPDKGSLLPAPAALLDLLRQWRWQRSDREGHAIQRLPHTGAYAVPHIAVS